MSEITGNLRAVKARIAAATEAADRPDGSCELIAVSKTKPASAVAEAAGDGQRHFGENYLQEALAKQDELAGEADELVWHFIGAIQSNKTRDIATRFDWVHTLEREKIARRLSDQRPDGRPPLNVLIQVNLQNEPTKAGVSPDEVVSLANAIAPLPGITVRGLMAIPAPATDHDEQVRVFRSLAAINETLKSGINTVDTLSMGMTDDMPAAIEAGATFVRIGTAIFGARDSGHRG